MVSPASVLRQPRTGRPVWKAPNPGSSQEWLRHLSPVHAEEIAQALRAVHASGIPLLKVTATHFPLPTLARELRHIADTLENGPGFALIKGLPVERCSEAAASLVFWGMCQHLGTPVSQNAAGHVLGHVRDTGRTMGDPAVRGYQTREALPFHTGGSDVLGLMCLRAARSGGRISVASSGAVYNEVLARRPDLVELLYRTYFLDRRQEQAPGEEPYYALPLACWYDGKLSMRYNRRFLESAQRFPGVPRLESADTELFDLMDEIADSSEFRCDVDFTEGDVLLINNHTVLHSRTDYEDFAEPDRKRHLLRLWLTLREGRRLPAEFWGDMHGNTRGAGRGGIAPRDVVAEHVDHRSKRKWGR
ncbi:TauD/TfdA family dioxygenase [Streptomyces sp. WAC 04229]|uniref:TauD/TfdA family dioxygenase n=1 Tax=Streptomyces sp. WAC 04229 TaxID=2203206 RepID=UPI003D748252